MKKLCVAVPPYHPNIPFWLGHSKYYILNRAREYATLTEHLKGAPVGCSAIYGVHDLLFFGVDESVGFFRLRLDSWFPPEVKGALEHGTRNVSR